MAEKQELLGKLKREQLLKELNDLNKGLISYKKRQEEYMKIKFSEGQKKNLDALRLRLQRKYNWNKEAASKYGGDVSIKILGVDWDTFVYSLRSSNMNPSQFSALDKAINIVTMAIKKVESIPVASTDWRDISVRPRPKDQAEESKYLFNTMQFHPIVVKASRSLFESGHYAEAIFGAFKAVENFVKEKSGSNLYGKQLMAKVFNEDNPIIQVPEAGYFDKDVQEGFRFLFMGASQGIRNPKAHKEIVQNDPYITLEYLGFASFLLKRISYWEAGTT